MIVTSLVSRGEFAEVDDGGLGEAVGLVLSPVVGVRAEVEDFGGGDGAVGSIGWIAASGDGAVSRGKVGGSFGGADAVAAWVGAGFTI